MNRQTRQSRWVRLGGACLVALFAAWAPSAAQAGGGFSYNEPGDLVPGSGTGAADTTVYAPGMRYPMEMGPSYPNSQVYGHGGYLGPAGGQCDAENYSYPWTDNYCETRSWDMPLCPSGEGHQGQDIRPATCEGGVHWNVSSEAGTVTNIGSYSVYVTAADGTRFDYLHGSGNVVSNGQGLDKGARINKVDNEFGGTSTTIHLHYNIKQDVSGLGFVFVSPYMSLVKSYEELLGISGGDVSGSASQDACSAIVGWAQDEADPEASIPVQVFFGGAADDPNAVGIEVVADIYREELCEVLGSCEHGFSVELPASLRDGQPHPVSIYGVGSEGGDGIAIDADVDFACEAPTPPPGVRRVVDGPSVIAAWGLSPFWDAAPVSDAVLGTVAVGEPFPEEPVLARTESEPGVVWLMDPGFKRQVGNAQVAEVWGLDLDAAEVWPDNVLADVAEGTPLREDLFMLSAPDGTLYVMDDEQCDPDDEECEPPEDPENESGTSGDGAETGDGGDDGSGGDGAGSGPALPGADMDSDGCGCRAQQGGGGLMWLLFMLPWLWRRRPATS